MNKRILLTLVVSGGLALSAATPTPAMAAPGHGTVTKSAATAKHAAAALTAAGSSGKGRKLGHTKVKHVPSRVFRAHGTVTAVDAAASTITIADPHGNTTTFTIDGGATITVDGTTVSLAALPVGLHVNLSGTPGDIVKIEGETD